MRYIEVSTLLLVPLTPHTCEHVWGQVLKRPGSVLTAGWPAAAEPDFVMQRASGYIEGVPGCVCVLGCLGVARVVCRRLAYAHTADGAPAAHL